MKSDAFPGALGRREKGEDWQEKRKECRDRLRGLLHRLGLRKHPIVAAAVVGLNRPLVKGKSPFLFWAAVSTSIFASITID